MNQIQIIFRIFNLHRKYQYHAHNLIIGSVGTGTAENKNPDGHCTSGSSLLNLAPQHGLEPRTHWLTANCSAN
jgi:hypothetical protein